MAQAGRSWLSRQAPELVARVEQARSRNEPFDCDLLIVGSGYGGAVAAARAAAHEIVQDGMRRPARVWLIERGSEYLPGMFPSRFSELAGHVRFDMQDGKPARGRPEGLFDARLGPDVCVLLGNGLGGGSLINAGVMLPPQAEVFASGWPSGINLDSATLQGGYRAAMDMLSPKPVPPNKECNKLHVLDALAGSRAERPPVTVHWENEPSSAGVPMYACTLCGDCLTGCNQGSKGSVDTNYLAHARARGVEMFCGGTVDRLERADGHWRVHWRYTDRALRPEQDPPFFVRARRVVLAAGTLGSTEILKRSETETLTFSDELGERFSTNGDKIAAMAKQPRRVGAVGEQETDPADIAARRVGPTITGLIRTPADQDDDGVARPGFAVQEFAVPAGLRNVYGEVVALLAEIDHAHIGGTDPFAVTDDDIDHIGLYGFMGDDGGDSVAGKSGKIVLPPEPSAGRGEGVHIEWLLLRLHPLYTRMGRWLEQRLAPGGIVVPSTEEPKEEEGLRTIAKLLPPITVHPLGGCCMADRCEDGVVDDRGRVFDPKGTLHEGLIVLDGSIVPGSLCINPALTIAALAERAMPLLLKEWGWQAAGPAPSLPARPSSQRRELPARDIVWSVRERVQGPFRLDDQRRFWARMDVEFEEIPGFRRALALRSRVVSVRRAELALYDAREGDEEFSIEDPPQAAPRQRCALAGSVDLFTPMPGDPSDGRARLVYRLTVQAVQGDGDLPLAVGDRLEGLKVFGVGPGSGKVPSPWRQLSEMDMRWNGRPIGRWALDMADLAQRRDPLLRLVRLSSMPDALDDAGAIVLYVLRRALARLESFFKEFKDLSPSDEGLLERWPAASDKHVVHLADGARLTRFAPSRPQGNLPPLMLVHGLGSSGASCVDEALPGGLVKFLCGVGRDVWVLDVRSSIGNEAARRDPLLFDRARRWTVEGVANADLPAAIDAILAKTGGEQVDVFAHCMGAMMFCLAALGSDAMKGKVRAAVLSQVGPLMRYSPLNRLRGYLASYLQEFLRIDTLDTTPDFVSRLQPDGSIEWKPRRDDDFAAIIVQRLVDLLLFTFPYPDDDEEAQRQQQIKDSDFRRVRHRGDAIFGQLFELENVDNDVLQRLQVLLGWVMVPMLAQAIHYARRNMLTDAAGRNAVLHQANFKERFDFPLLMIHGRRNRVFDWRGSRDSLQLLMRLRDQGELPAPARIAHGQTYGAGTATQLAVFDNYGHLDCIIGEHAHEHVFPLVGRFFDSVTDLPRFGSKDVGPQIDVPWIGPVLGALEAAGDDFVRVRVLLHPQLRRAGTKGVIVLPLRAADPPFEPLICEARYIEWPTADSTHEPFDLPIARATLEHDFHAFALLTVHDDLPIGPRILKWLPDVARLSQQQDKALRLWLANPGNLGELASSVFTLAHKVVETAILKAPVPPSKDTRLRFALASCQYPPGLFDERPAAAAYQRLLADAVAPDGPQFLVLCGDQVYLDATAGLFDPVAASGGNNDVQDSQYDRSYELNWRLAAMRATVARLPVFAMLDDHEVKDNWKGLNNEPDPPPEPVQRAMRAYDRYQAVLNAGRSLTGKATHGRSFVAYPGGVPLIVLDTRSRRSLRDASNITSAGIVPPEVMQALLKQLVDAPPQAVKLVVSPSPILPPERYDPRYPAERLRSDSWSGFPASTVELMTFIRDKKIRRVVFLSGDAHLSSVSSFTFEGTQHKVVSVVSSGLYTPWPFANQRPSELDLDGTVDLGWTGNSCEGTMALHAMSANNGHAVVGLRHTQGDQAWLDVSLRSANGATTDCSVALD